MIDLCTDCTWMTGNDIVKGKAEKKSRGSSSRIYGMHSTIPAAGDQINTNDDRVEDDRTKDETSLLPSKEKTQDNHNPARVVKTNENHNTTCVDMDDDECTEIEIEYGGESTKSPAGNAEAAHKSLPREAFYQLGQAGNVNMVRQGEVEEISHKDNGVDIISEKVKPDVQSDAGGDSLTMDKASGYALEKSKSWSAPEKNAYLRAMAQKAKEDFRRKKGLEDVTEGLLLRDAVAKGSALAMSHSEGKGIDDDDDSLDEILATPKPSTSDWTKEDWTPAEKRRFVQLVNSEKSLSPEEATQKILASRCSTDAVNEVKLTNVRSKEFDKSASFSTQFSKESINHPPSASFKPIGRNTSCDDFSCNAVDTSSEVLTRELSVPFGSQATDHEIDMSKPRESKSDNYTNNMDSKLTSSILSNIQKKSGFIEVIEGNLNNSFDEDLERQRRTGTRQLEFDNVKSASSKKKNKALHRNGSIIRSGKEKRDPKKGANWHQMADTFSDEDKVAIDVHESDLCITDDEKSIFSLDKIKKKNVEKGESSLPIAACSIDKDDNVLFERHPLSSIKVDSRNNSCDVSILGNSLGLGDGTSIMSGWSSIYTTATNATAWSTSTRMRHRGAAKNRITDSVKQDSNLKKSGGWAQSMKAAAAANNCEWNKKDGFVDYVPPEEIKEKNIHPEAMHLGRLKTAMSRKKLLEANQLNGEAGEVVCSNIPFPPGWYKDREAIIALSMDDDGDASAVTEVISNKNQSKKFSVSRISHNSKLSRIFQPLDDAHEESFCPSPDDKQDYQCESSDEPQHVKGETVSTQDNKNGCSNCDKSQDITNHVTTGWDLPLSEDSTPQIEHFHNEDENEFNPSSKELLKESSTGDIGVKTSLDRPMSIKTTADLHDSEGETKDVGSETSNYKGRDEADINSGSISCTNEREEEAMGQALHSRDSDGEIADEFNQSNASFDYSTEEPGILRQGSESSFDNGFKVIEDSTDVPDFLKSENKRKLNSAVPVLSDVENKRKTLIPSSIIDISYEAESNHDSNIVPPPIDDRSTFEGEKSVQSYSTNDSMLKAKKWMKMVESKNKDTKLKNENEQKTEDCPIFVSAVDESSTFDYRDVSKNRTKDNDSVFDHLDNDTLFDFNGTEANTCHRSPLKESPSYKKRPKCTGTDFYYGGICTLDKDDETSTSDITSPVSESSAYCNIKGESLLSRLKSCTTQSCTAPVMNGFDDRDDGSDVPTAHLEFLRKSQGVSSHSGSSVKRKQQKDLLGMFSSSNFCGRPESIYEEDEDVDEDENEENKIDLAGEESKDDLESKTVRKSSIASVYLEAIRTKNEIENKKEDISAYVPSPTSIRSARSSGKMSKKSTLSAEEYAAKKVDEIIRNITYGEEARFSKTSDSPLRSKPLHYGFGRGQYDEKTHENQTDSTSASEELARARMEAKTFCEPVQSKRRGDAAKAAEDLAASRVEAMMYMMSSSNLEEAEV